MPNNTDGDPLFATLWESNEEIFADAKDAIVQRVLAATIKAAFEELGSSESIATKALRQVDVDHALIREAICTLNSLLVKYIARRSTDDLTDTPAVARQARERIEEEHTVIVAAKNLLKVSLIDEIAQNATSDLADPNKTAQKARQHIGEDEKTLTNAQTALIENLLTEIADRSTEVIADAGQAALKARKHIDEESVGGVVDELKKRLVAEIANRSLDDLADLELTVDKALAHVDEDHHVILRAVDRLKEEILQTVVQQTLAKISKEVGVGGDPPIPKAAAKSDSVTATRATTESKAGTSAQPAEPPKMQRRIAANGSSQEPEPLPKAVLDDDLAQAYYVHAIVAKRGRDLAEALAAADRETAHKPFVIPFKTLAVIASRAPGARPEDDGHQEALHDIQESLLEHLCQTGVAALPMYAETLYASEADVVASLAAHAQNLESHLSELSRKRVWDVKVYCDLEKIKQEIHSTDASIDAFLGQILQDVDEWSARGTAEELKAVQEGMNLSLEEMMESLLHNCKQNVHRALLQLSEASHHFRSSKESVFGHGRMVLNASYMLEESEGVAFRAELERLATVYEGLGLVYYVSGPHPPCRFRVPGAPEL